MMRIFSPQQTYATTFKIEPISHVFLSCILLLGCSNDEGDSQDFRIPDRLIGTWYANGGDNPDTDLWKIEITKDNVKSYNSNGLHYSYVLSIILNNCTGTEINDDLTTFTITMNCDRETYDSGYSNRFESISDDEVVLTSTSFITDIEYSKTYTTTLTKTRVSNL